MASKWYKNFLYALDGVGIPEKYAPESLFGTCAAATASIGAMVKALQAAGGERAKEMSLRALVTTSKAIGVDVESMLGELAAGDLLLVAGGVGAAWYIGCCVGAAIAATASSVWDWADSVFSHDDATQNFQQISNTASNYTNVPTLSCPEPAPAPVCSDSSDAGSSGDDSSNPAPQVCQVPVASCNSDGIGDTDYSPDWPTKPNY